MSIVSAIFSGIGSFFLSLWGLFTYWLWVFAIPFTSVESIWLIIPVWASWFFAEFFQEKQGTSFGNAISNGVVPLWAGVDWMRQITQNMIASHTPVTFLIVMKYFISMIAIVFGLIIIIAGIKGKDYVHFAGRIRVVTYFVVMFTPLVYDLIRLNLSYFISIIMFFPLFYFLIEFIDEKTPKPKAVEMDEVSPGQSSVSGYRFPSSSSNSSGSSSRFSPSGSSGQSYGQQASRTPSQAYRNNYPGNNYPQQGTSNQSRR